MLKKSYPTYINSPTLLKVTKMFHLTQRENCISTVSDTTDAHSILKNFMKTTKTNDFSLEIRVPGGADLPIKEVINISLLSP